MRLKLMAPFRSHFCLNAGVLPLNEMENDYLHFWTELQNKNQNKELTFLHRKDSLKKVGKTLYERIDEDTLKCSLHILELTPKDEKTITDAFNRAVQEAKQDARDTKYTEMYETISKLCEPDADSVSIRVYDNTISIAQIDVALNLNDHVNNSNYQLFLDALHNVAIIFAYNYIVELYNSTIFPILDSLSNQPGNDSSYIKSFKMYDDFRDMLQYVEDRQNQLSHGDDSETETTVLWVTRTLLFEKGDSDKEFFANLVQYWLKDIGDEKQKNHEINTVQNNPKAYSMSWLNYAFREQAFAEHVIKQNGSTISTFGDAWESMLMAQYFYSALESLNNNLQRVIRRSYMPEAEKNLRDLNLQLKRTTATTNLLIIYYNDLQKYLQRDKKATLDKIMKGWGFDGLRENAEKRILLCNTRLDNMHKVSTERSSLATDLLLFGIGAVSFIGLIISLSQYGRLMNTDATLGFRDDGPFNIFGAISVWPMDYVFVGTILIILVLTFFYYMFRKKKLL